MRGAWAEPLLCVSGGTVELGPSPGRQDGPRGARPWGCAHPGAAWGALRLELSSASEMAEATDAKRLVNSVDAKFAMLQFS